MKKEAKKIDAPWQHRFMAGIFPQLRLHSDREVALHLKERSSFPKDGFAEKVLREFTSGRGGFPEEWKVVLLKECRADFIERWREYIFETVLNQRIQIQAEQLPKTNTSTEESKTQETKPLPESIIKILTVSISESLDGSGKLNPRKLVRALNNRSSNYEVKRKEREIFFQGKRVTHRFTIPSDIELTA